LMYRSYFSTYNVATDGARHNLGERLLKKTT